jgi:hypothetical protein
MEPVHHSKNDRGHEYFVRIDKTSDPNITVHGEEGQRADDPQASSKSGRSKGREPRLPGCVSQATEQLRVRVGFQIDRAYPAGFVATPKERSTISAAIESPLVLLIIS